MAWLYVEYQSALAPPGWGDRQKENNATEAWRFFYERGYSMNAVAGMLGNWELESHINPGQTEGGGGGGYGLAQWTPKSNLTNWTRPRGYADYSGEGQCRWIDENTVPFGQWIPTARYPYSWYQFKTTDLAPGDAAMCYEYNFERGTPFENLRRAYAEKWFEFLGGVILDDKIPYWLLKRIAQNSRKDIYI